ncbi:hypothetical protein [Spiroplasma culicicola]|nr:hypothetical protein [Spiroplasma culicicola]
MKKILNLLAFFCVANTSITSVVACTFDLSTPQNLKKIDTNRLSYEILTFIYTSKTLQKSLEEVVKDANENLIIYTPGIFQVKAESLTNDQISFEFNVYSNYDNVENIDHEYTLDQNIVAIKLEDIEAQINKVLEIEKIYHTEADAQKSIKKALQFVDGISINKINALENINDLFIFETIDNKTEKWVLDVDFLKRNCLNENYIIDTTIKTISGEFNLIDQSDQLKAFLYEPLRNMIKGSTGTEFLYDIIDEKNTSYKDMSIYTLLEYLIGDILDENNKENIEKYSKKIIIQIIELLSSDPKGDTPIIFSYEGFETKTLRFRFLGHESFLQPQFEDFLTASSEKIEISLMSYNNFIDNTNTKTSLVFNALFNIKQTEYWYFSDFVHNE